MIETKPSPNHRRLNVLVACEYSGLVRDEFIRLGHNAISCDLLPSDTPGPHYQGDFHDLLAGQWDLILAFTPCTYSCNSGLRWMYNADKSINQERYALLQQYAGMIKTLLASDCKHVVCENPIPHYHAVEVIGRKYDQIVQPWWFGHGETKATCLWLKNLPPLQATNIVSGREHRVHRMPPGPDRWKERSKTFPGIASALAHQYAEYILSL